MRPAQKRQPTGHLNKSSADLFTLDALMRRELWLKARHIRGSSAAWVALQNQPVVELKSKRLPDRKTEGTTSKKKHLPGNSNFGATTTLIPPRTGNTDFWRNRRVSIRTSMGRQHTSQSTTNCCRTTLTSTSTTLFAPQ